MMTIIITITNTQTTTSYITYIQLKHKLVLVSRMISIFQLQAEHRHAAGLISLLF